MERNNGVYYKAKRSKIRRLENEIAKMQLDNEKTFSNSYDSPENDKIQFHKQIIQLFIFIFGVVSLGIGLWQSFSILSIKSGLAFLMLGNLKISNGICSIPVVAGVLTLVLFKKKAFPIALTSVGAVILLMNLIFDVGRISVEHPAISMIGVLALFCITLGGAALLTASAIMLRKMCFFK